MVTCAGLPCVESGAIHTVNCAGSTTSFMSMFQNFNSSRPSVNSTFCDWPGASVMRRKPFNSRTGRTTLVPGLANVQLHHFVGGAAAGVAHLGRDFQAGGAGVKFLRADR